MDATYDRARSLLRLDLPDDEAVAGFASEALARGAFLVELADGPGVHDEVEVEVAVQGRSRAQARARSVQVFDRGGGRSAVALEVLGGRSGLERLARRSSSEESETVGASPAFRIRELAVPERIRLAMRADRTERQILLRDGTPQVAMALLANPRLEEAEVLELVRVGSSTGVLERVAKESRWTANYEIRKALASHPRTPTPQAIRFLPTLSKQDLGRLARAGGAREPVRKAALKLYLKKM